VSLDDAWTAYVRTIVDIGSPDRRLFRIVPAPQHDVGVWPQQFNGPVFVLTAWDPGVARYDIDTNRAHQKSLESDLRCLTMETWPAVGWTEYSDHREEGVAAAGLSEEDAVALGARYGQNAIFAWTPTAWLVVSCVDDRRHEAGWRLFELATS